MSEKSSWIGLKAHEHIGKTYRWRAQWVVTEEDGGPYVGQVAWLPEDHEVRLGWVPDEDLETP